MGARPILRRSSMAVNQPVRVTLASSSSVQPVTPSPPSRVLRRHRRIRFADRHERGSPPTGAQPHDRKSPGAERTPREDVLRSSATCSTAAACLWMSAALDLESRSEIVIGSVATRRRCSRRGSMGFVK